MPPPATHRSAADPPEPAVLAPGAGRLTELDAARAILMMLGIVVHAANPYAVGSSWIVADGNDQRWLEYLQGLPHAFRMSGFFLLAGLLGTLALHKRGARDFLGRRAGRLLWPLATALLTINSLQYWYVHHYIDTRCAGRTFACAAHATPGLWVAHLWFLFYLMGYSLLLPALVRACHWQPLRALLRRTPAARLPLAVAVAAPFAGALLIKACAMRFAWFYDRQLGIGSLYDFLHHGLYFALGVLVASWPRLRERLLTLPLATALLLTLAGTAAYFAGKGLAGTPGNGARAAQMLGYACTAVLTIGGVRLFMLLSRRLPGLAMRVADSSYTVYLFHHLVVIVMALALVGWAGPGWAKFLLVCAVAGGGGYLLHRRVIARSPLLRLLYNGVR